MDSMVKIIEGKSITTVVALFVESRSTNESSKIEQWTEAFKPLSSPPVLLALLDFSLAYDVLFASGY